MPNCFSLPLPPRNATSSHAQMTTRTTAKNNSNNNNNNNNKSKTQDKSSSSDEMQDEEKEKQLKKRKAVELEDCDSDKSVTTCELGDPIINLKSKLIDDDDDDDDDEEEQNPKLVSSFRVSKPLNDASDSDKSETTSELSDPIINLKSAKLIDDDDDEEEENPKSVSNCEISKSLKDAWVLFPTQSDVDDDDRISGLPDEILARLVSLLELKEAGRTSVLSRRWRYLWADSLTDLKFENNSSSPDRITTNREHAAWVNQVVNSHRPPFINTFKVKHPLNVIWSSDVDNWVAFALEKRVQNLDLDFTFIRNGCNNYKDAYTFKSSSLLSLCRPPNTLGLTLESLSLAEINLSQPLLDCLFTSCPNLERLSLRRSSCPTPPAPLLTFRVSSPKLKHLELISCFCLEKLDLVFAPNLTCFIHSGRLSNIQYRHVPSLVKATFGGPCATGLLYDQQRLSALAPQLEYLSVAPSGSLGTPSASSALVTFPNLQCLELGFHCAQVLELPSLISFLERCPLLQIFQFKLLGWPPSVDDTSEEEEESKTEILSTETEIVEMQTLMRLKTVEYVGYIATMSATKLALCLAKHAPMLGKFVFDPRMPELLGHPARRFGNRSIYTDRINLAKKDAELLAKQIMRVKQEVEIINM